MTHNLNYFARSLVLRLLVLSVVALCLTSVLPAAADSHTKKKKQTRTPFVITYVMLEDDPYYAPRRAYTGLVLNAPHRPLDGVKLGLRESRVLGRAMKLKYELQEVVLTVDGDHQSVLAAALQDAASNAVVLDLPKKMMTDLVRQFKGSDVLFFNPRHADDDLRHELCQPQLFHTVPSRAMLSDALVQYLVKKKWPEVLILEGPLDEDKQLSASFQRSAKKFGVSVVAVHPFVLSNNPRDRDESNVAIMTGRPDHDVVFVADTYGEFARYVPYQTLMSRLVIGSEGLIPAAWHWTWERHGAPQLNQRFDKLAKRRMNSEDWAGWAAVKSLTTSIARGKSITFAEIRTHLTSEDIRLDAYKGVPSNYRSWNNQLRQSILLHTHNAVVERAPLEEFLHRTNTLDSLGVDKPETKCSM